MQCKILIPFFSSLLFSLVLEAQTPFEAEVVKAIRYIERNITVNSNTNPKSKVDFFLYDIQFDTTGKISYINILRTEDTRYLYEARRIADSLVLKWTPVVSYFKKIFIPVLIVNSTDEEDESVQDQATKRTVSFFDKIAGKNLDEEVYISKVVTIIWMSINKKRN